MSDWAKVADGLHRHADGAWIIRRGRAWVLHFVSTRDHGETWFMAEIEHRTLREAKRFFAEDVHEV